MQKPRPGLDLTLVRSARISRDATEGFASHLVQRPLNQIGRGAILDLFGELQCALQKGNYLLSGVRLNQRVLLANRIDSAYRHNRSVQAKRAAEAAPPGKRWPASPDCRSFQPSR
jgi:hypothetical protein